MSGHVFNVVVVPNEGVSIDSVLICFLEPLGKQSWVLLIEKDLDSEESTSLFGVLPETFKSLAPGKVLLYLDAAPVTEAVFVSPETLGTSSIGFRVFVLS